MILPQFNNLKILSSSDATSAAKLSNQSPYTSTFNNIDDLAKFIQEYSDRNSASQFNFNKSLQDEAMQFNAQQAQINRDFQERMASTQYQRAVKDLEAAGLNKLLAYSNLTGSTPSGSVASSSASSVGRGTDISSLLSSVINSASSDKRGIMNLIGTLIKSVGSIGQLFSMLFGG